MTTPADRTIVTADFSRPDHAAALIKIMDSYAAGETGTGSGLSESVRTKLPAMLAEIQHGFSLLAYKNDVAAGLANCFMQFSTFQCMPIINIHDLAVCPDHQREGIGSALIAAVVQEAERRGCCKVTLEVLSGNTQAQRLYQRHGFGPYQLQKSTGYSLFWEKPLSDS